MMNYIKKNNTIIVSTGENLTINEVENSWICMDEIFRHYPDSIALDLSELSSIDSAGVGFLVRLYKRSRIYCIDLVFIGMSDSLIRLFSITGLLSFFNIMPKEMFNESLREYSLY